MYFCGLIVVKRSFSNLKPDGYKLEKNIRFFNT